MEKPLEPLATAKNKKLDAAQQVFGMVRGASFDMASLIEGSRAQKEEEIAEEEREATRREIMIIVDHKKV